MKNFWTKSAAAGILLVFAVFLQAKDIVLYHTSDTHGYYFAQENNKGKKQGGFATLASFIKTDSRNNKNYLLLDSGDFIQGNLEANDSEGATSVDIFNAAGYNAVTIGNHEFDYRAGLSKITPLLKADILAANMPDVPGAKPYKIYELDGVKIAVIGLGLNGEKNADKKTKKPIYTVLDSKESFNAAIEEAARQKPDAFVLLIHGSNNDPRVYAKPLEIIKNSPYPVHVVLQGHMHDKGARKINDVLYVDSGTRLQFVSKITLTFDDNTNKFEKAEAQKIDLYPAGWGEDIFMLDLVDKVKNPAYDVVYGRSKDLFDFEPQRKGYLDTELGNFMTDIMIEETGAELAIVNTKAFRNFIPKGELTNRNLKQAMPYDNKLSVMNVDGKFIKKVVEENLRANNSLFQYSGLKIKAVFNGKELEKVDITANCKPLDPEKKYSVATNDFIAFTCTYEAEMFKEIPEEDKKIIEKNISDIIIEKFKRTPKVKAPKSDRIKVTVKHKKD